VLKPSPRTIDVHAHALSPRLVELTSGHLGMPNPHNEQLMRTRYKRPFESLDARLETMDRQGIDIQVVSHMPVFGYSADADTAPKIVDAANTHVAELCQARPDRLVGLCFVALQFPELAPRQLEEAMASMGMRGVEIATRVNDLELDDERLEPFWAAAEQLSALVFIHPAGTTLGVRVAKYYLSNIVGNPLDTTLALSHLIFGGVLERHPRLKIVAAHGGGYLPSYAARSDHALRVAPDMDTGVKLQKKPTEYLRQLYYDTLVFTSEALRHLAAEVGAEQLVLGTDHPIPWQPAGVDHILQAEGFSDDERMAMLGGTAVRLLKIPLD
jgi:aminocarboxymuconate-semialdehyde decarboxylase